MNRKEVHKCKRVKQEFWPKKIETKSKRINPISGHFLQAKAGSKANAKAVIEHFNGFFLPSQNEDALNKVVAEIMDSLSLI